MKMIPPEDRGKYRCHFCLSDKSVRYMVKCFDPLEDENKPVTVPCCNRCVLFYGMKNEEGEN